MGVFASFYPLRWGPCSVDVGGRNTSKHIVIQMEWEICLPMSKFCRWEEEMTMGLVPRWPARMLLRTQWRQTEGWRREEVFCSLKMWWPRWRDAIAFSASFSGPFQRRSSLVVPSPDCGSHAGSPPKTCWLHDWGSALFLCGFRVRFVVFTSCIWEQRVHHFPALWASQKRVCLERRGCTFRLKREKLKRVYWKP